MNINKYWYRPGVSWTILLWPLELIFKCLAKINKNKKIAQQWVSSCPVIVVGNISVGGTGKSPLTILLIEQLQQQGYKVGVVSRGYGSKRTQFPYQVKQSDSVFDTADEPLMIVQRTSVNLVIDPDRVRACQYLLSENECDIIISDDGLQHYNMGRDIEISVIDSSRGLGNKHCLPVGPLREPVARLNDMDFIVKNGSGDISIPFEHYAMHLKLTGWFRVIDGQFFTIAEFLEQIVSKASKVHAYAGIGNPDRFFDCLFKSSIHSKNYAFADHYQYTASDFQFPESDVICMTEKDAVKCRNLVSNNSFYLQISAEVEDEFLVKLNQKINEIRKLKE